MKENSESILKTLIEHNSVTQVESTDWGMDCLEKMRKAANRVLFGYPCADENVEDAVHDALVAALNIVQHGKESKIDNPKTYLIAAAANNALNRAKSLNVKRYDPSVDDEDFPELSDKLLSHPKAFEIRTMYRECFNTLSYKEQVVLKMMAFGMPVSEIADALSKTKNAVYISEHRIREKMFPLREYLNW